MKVVVKNVYKKYVKNGKEIEVLKDLSTTFESGKLYAIIGESGAGKSTFLKCMATLLPVDDGYIFYDDIEINKLNDEEVSIVRNDKIGMIYQEYNLLDFLTTYENVAMPLIIKGVGGFKDKKISDKVMELLKFVGLEERSSHYPRELSGGEQQRVAIARALVNNPDIILADEPTGSIDKNNTNKILELLKDISKEKCVIVVTHDDEVLKYADKVFSLEEGKLIDYEVKN